MSANLKRTPLYEKHAAAHGKLVDFAGWEMPVNYGSQINEHHAVRRAAGMFDVSHMRAIDVTGADATKFLRHLFANDVNKLDIDGKALYTCMLNEQGGVIDDLIVYRNGDNDFRVVLNAGCADGDMEWIRQQLKASGMAVDIAERTDLAMLAIQGPQALELTSKAIPELAKIQYPAFFPAAQFGDFYVARTGYTGEDGIELSMPAARAGEVWDALVAAGVQPCGLGARDTLRLEAGMNLYGQDMDAEVSPFDAGLAWTVDRKDPERNFIGKAALDAHGPRKVFLGLILADRGVLRSHMKVATANGSGETTSGTFSPSMEKSIAFARLPAGTAADETVEVDIRGKPVKARTVKLPFVRNGKVLV